MKIYRTDSETGEHYVVFNKDVICELSKKFARNKTSIWESIKNRFK